MSIDGVIIPNIINTVKIAGPMYTDFILNNIKTVKVTSANTILITSTSSFIPKLKKTGHM